MARGRHRRRSRRLTRFAGVLVGVVLLLGVSACEGTAPGNVTNKVYKENSPRYLLEVQQPDGQRVLVSVNRIEWERCSPGEVYPDCKRPPNPDLRKV